MKKILICAFLLTNAVFAKESLAPDSVKISKKVIEINQQALREPASNKNEEEKAETLSEAMEKVEEPKLWFQP